MSELLHNIETFKIIGLCMEIHRSLGKGYDEVIYKDALEVECKRNAVTFAREKKNEIEYKGVILPHFYYADFVIFEQILLEAKACERLTDAHAKQVLNYLAASKLRVGLLVNFGEGSLSWKRIIRTESTTIEPPDLQK